MKVNFLFSKFLLLKKLQQRGKKSEKIQVKLACSKYLMKEPVAFKINENEETFNLAKNVSISVMMVFAKVKPKLRSVCVDNQRYNTGLV